MAMAEKSRFHRLLDILVPDGGAVVLMYEAYFDESGDFDEEPGVFCIAGYYIRSQDAALMDKEWADVLEKYGVPYFHMVDCAHGAPPFDGLSLHDRIQIVKDLINLVKQYTIDGFAIIGKKEFYLAENEDDDEYSRFVEMSVQAVERALDVDRISGPVSYFFETGHSRKGRAYNRVADKIANMPDSTITFGKKAEIRLLQAGDLLAWQCAKYAKDGVTGARGPRKDFLSLMEHRHMLAFLDARDGEPVISFEAYPHI